MRISLMDLQHSKDRDRCRIISNNMVNMVSKDNSSRTTRGLRIKTREGPSLLKMISFMGENKRLLNIQEQNFAELAAFQGNTTLFQANMNASLKNLETQVGHLALPMKNQSNDAFPNDTRKNPNDCMVVTLRSGR